MDRIYFSSNHNTHFSISREITLKLECEFYTQIKQLLDSKEIEEATYCKAIIRNPLITRANGPSEIHNISRKSLMAYIISNIGSPNHIWLMVMLLVTLKFHHSWYL